MVDIAKTCAFFDSMVNLIPVDYYYPKQQTHDNKYLHNKKADPSLKEAAKKRRKEHTKVLYDPTKHKTVLDVQRDLARHDSSSSSSSSKPIAPSRDAIARANAKHFPQGLERWNGTSKKRKHEEEEEEEEEDQDQEEEEQDQEEVNGDEDEQEDEEEDGADDDEEQETEQMESLDGIDLMENEVTEDGDEDVQMDESSEEEHTSAMNPEKEAIRRKQLGNIAHKQKHAKSQASVNPSSLLNPSSAPVAMDALRARLHDRIESLKHARSKEEPHQEMSKRAMRKQKKEEKQKQAKMKGTMGNKPSMSLSTPATAPAIKRLKASGSPLINSPSPPSQPPPLPSHDIPESFSFGTISIPQRSSTKSYALQLEERLKKKPGDRAALKQVESFDKEIQRLREIDAEAADRKVEERAYDHAMLRAQGVRVKDDAKLLKKSIKRDSKKKFKSSAAWMERKKIQDEEKSQRLAKREDNIKARKDKKQGKPVLEETAPTTTTPEAPKSTRKSRAAAWKGENKRAEKEENKFDRQFKKEIKQNAEARKERLKKQREE